MEEVEMKYVLLFVGTMDDQERFDNMSAEEMAAGMKLAEQWFEEYSRAGTHGSAPRRGREAHRRDGAPHRQLRHRGGGRPGQPGRGAGELAGPGNPGQPRRVVDDGGAAPRHRPAAPRPALRGENRTPAAFDDAC